MHKFLNVRVVPVVPFNILTGTEICQPDNCVLTV